jgi:hypothetical protein
MIRESLDIVANLMALTMLLAFVAGFAVLCASF